MTVLTVRFDGRRVDGPNDVVVGRMGHIWFTDPGYGILCVYEGDRGTPELPACVYRLDADGGRAEAVADALKRPNGLCFFPDQTILYVVDTGCTDNPACHRNIMAFDVQASCSLGGLRAFCDLAPGRSDAIRCDVDGNLWSASGFGGPQTNGVRVFAPDGAPIGRIDLPEPASKLCFGGRVKNRVFIAAGPRSIHCLWKRGDADRHANLRLPENAYWYSHMILY